MAHLDAAVLDMAPVPLERSQAVAGHKQSQDLWAERACTAPARGCEWAAGQNCAHQGLDAGVQAEPTSLGH